MGTLREEVRSCLFDMAEEEYRKFHSSLVPGTNTILGVRLPKIRALAKEIAKKDCSGYLDEVREVFPEDPNVSYEEIMLEGLVIGYGKLSLEERLSRLDTFVPKIQNWAVCDSTAGTYQFMRKYQKECWEYLQKYLKSDREFEVRFALVSILAHFIREDYLEEIFAVCNQVHPEGYYAKMAMAWLVSVCYVKFPKQTEAFLSNNELDDFTQNKSIQKIRESFRVSREEKERILQFRRTNV